MICVKFAILTLYIGKFLEKWQKTTKSKLSIHISQLFIHLFLGKKLYIYISWPWLRGPLYEIWGSLKTPKFFPLGTQSLKFLPEDFCWGLLSPKNAIDLSRSLTPRIMGPEESILPLNHWGQQRNTNTLCINLIKCESVAYSSSRNRIG